MQLENNNGRYEDEALKAYSTGEIGNTQRPRIPNIEELSLGTPAPVKKMQRES